jgi:trehalose 6-phosphate synthase
LKKPKVQERIATLEKKFQGVKLIVGVDRLDYIKGVPQKLHALEVFLTEHPEWIGKVVLVQVAVPSRQDVEEYQNLRAVVNELVGRINGKFGTIEFMPIHFMHKSVSFDELIALYAVSDVCLVSSTRDGMNLVSYEYIACQQKRHGVMILSEFTGAAQSLNGSIIVNPWNTEELADAIHDAVTMGEDQRLYNYQKLAKYVNKYTRYVTCYRAATSPANTVIVHGGASLSSTSSAGYQSRDRAKSELRRALSSAPRPTVPPERVTTVPPYLCV